MSTSKQLELLRKIVRELIQQELGEASTTGNLDGGAGPPKTPYAFQSKPKSKKDKEKDKDLRLLAYQILVDKFNTKYKSLNESQKDLLKNYINNISNTNSLREFVDVEVNKTKKELQKHLEANSETYLITVDSVMCTKSMNQIMDLYNSIQDFLVEKHLRELYELSNRQVYKDGKYYYQTRGIFEAHLKKFLGDRTPTEKDYFDKLLYRPDSKDYDNLNT